MDTFARTINSTDDVIKYLVQEYEVSAERAKNLCIKYDAEIKEAQARGSFIYYIGNGIADNEGLEPLEDVDDEEIAFEDDET